MQTILITGARSGIAREVIDKLKHDYHIIVAVHTLKQLEMVQKYYMKYSNITCIKLDITCMEDLEQIQKYDIDILLNNAAIGEGGSMAEIPLSKVRNNFEVNVFGTLEIIQIILKQMIQKKKGRIVVMSSLAGIVPIPFLGSYSATKASLIQMTQALKKELSYLDVNIDICLIEPGFYHTGFNQVMFNNKYEWMELDSYFEHQIQMIKKRESIIERYLEKKRFNGIVKQVIGAIKKPNPKFIWRAPYSQVFFAKLYQIFKQ